MSKAIVTFVVISYNETDDFHVSLGSFLCQKNPNWKAIVFHDGPNEETRKLVESFKDERIFYVESEKDETNSWGCYNRKRGLEMVDTDFTIQTTAQEYYLPNLVEEIEKRKYEDFIYWPCIHHSFDYNILNSEPVKGRIDWSNFAIRTSIARKVGINYPNAYMADGVFVEECMKSGFIKRKVKIDKIFNIKN